MRKALCIHIVSTQLQGTQYECTSCVGPGVTCVLEPCLMLGSSPYRINDPVQSSPASKCSVIDARPARWGYGIASSAQLFAVVPRLRDISILFVPHCFLLTPPLLSTSYVKITAPRYDLMKRRTSPTHSHLLDVVMIPSQASCRDN